MWRRGRLRIAVVIVIGLLTGSTTAQTSDKSSVEELAKQFLRAADETDIPGIYRDIMGASFRGQYPESLFEQNIGMSRIQQGGAAQSRELVGSQPMSFIPTNGQQGTFYYVRFRTRYPNGVVFQDVYLDKENNDWKIFGWQTLPAP